MTYVVYCPQTGKLNVNQNLIYLSIYRYKLIYSLPQKTEKISNNLTLLQKELEKEQTKLKVGRK